MKKWIIKRILLNIIWFVLNVIILIVLSVLISKYLHWFLIIWYCLVFIYSLLYRIISIELFDLLIGDGL